MGNFVIIGVVVLTVLSVGYFADMKAKRLINEWAETNNYKIVSLEKRIAFKEMDRDPFRYDFRSPIFCVTVEEAGVIKNAYVKCGSGSVGLLLGFGFEVRWVLKNGSQTAVPEPPQQVNFERVKGMKTGVRKTIRF